MIPQQRAGTWGAATLAIVVAAAAWATAAPSGPSVTGGKNPLMTLNFQTVNEASASTGAAKGWKVKQVYEVPPGRRLVITDLLLFTAPPPKPSAENTYGLSCGYPVHACLIIDGKSLWCQYVSYQTGSLTDGIPIDAGAKVSLALWAQAKKEKCWYGVSAVGHFERP